MPGCGFNPMQCCGGKAKRSSKDYRNYLEIAFGSSFELETELLVIDMLGFCDKHLLQDLLNDVDEEQKMLHGFIKTVEIDG